MVVGGGHFLESLSSFQDKLNSYVAGSDDEIAIVSEDDASNVKNSKASNKRGASKATNKKSTKPESIKLDDSDPEEIDVESEEDTTTKRSKNKPTASKKVARKTYDEEEEEESPEEEDNSDDEDYGNSKKKKAPSKKVVSKKKKSHKKGASRSNKDNKKGKQTSANKPSNSNRNSNSRSSKVNYKDEDEEDDYISSDDPESDFNSEDDAPKRKGKKPASSRSAESKSKLPKPIAVSEMVIDSIKALGDNPKKGSSLRSIKETIEMNWSVNIKACDAKIKKFITEAIDEGKIERVKGSGFSGRFTVPGLKLKKKKKKEKLGKIFDNEEEEYTPKRSKRDEDREKDKEEDTKIRQERWEKEEEKWAQWEVENANKPKKAKIEKEWEVESIKSIKEKDGEKQFLVKFKGIAKPRWEPEQNILNCEEAIEEYVNKQNEIEEEKANCKKMLEEGRGEVARIVNVQFKKVNKEEKREFLIRWKGLGSESDTWEPEEKLICTEMIKKYMKVYETRTEASNERELRDAPKAIQRLEYASKTKSGRRTGKAGKGFRKTYAGMDEEDDWKP